MRFFFYDKKEIIFQFLPLRTTSLLRMY